MDLLVRPGACSVPSASSAESSETNSNLAAWDLVSFAGVDERLLESLAAEPVDEREVNELLSRLTAQSLGGESELPTIRAVAEATGESVERVATLLAEMRAASGANLRQRLSAVEESDRLQDARIENLERSFPRAPVAPGLRGPYGRDHFRSPGSSVGAIFAVILSIVVLCTWMIIASSTHSPSTSEPTCSVEGKPIDCVMLGPYSGKK